MWFTGGVTPARRLWPDPYDSPMVRHRWVFVAFVVFWTVMVFVEMGNAIRLIRNHLPFDSSFWFGPVGLFVIATVLVRVRRFRQAAAARAQSRY